MPGASTRTLCARKNWKPRQCAVTLLAQCPYRRGSDSLPAHRTDSLSKRPFKGKEAQPTFAGECEAVRDVLLQRAQRLVAQAPANLFSRLSAVLTHQPTAAGTVFLRWRNVDRSFHVCPGNPETGHLLQRFKLRSQSFVLLIEAPAIARAKVAQVKQLPLQRR
jgi:hypothetical protein